jgi:hypothetical protein
MRTFDPTASGIQYNVHIPGFHKTEQTTDDVMSVKEWLDGVKTHFFIDYDGFGEGIRSDGTFIQKVWPSMAKDISPEVEWIVWYNR